MHLGGALHTSGTFHLQVGAIMFKQALHRLLIRRQAAQTLTALVKAGVGGLLAIATIAWLGQLTGSPLLIAPFGATCVLLFSVPASPLSQPVNVIGGHLVSSAVGLSLHTLLPMEWWSLGLAVGMAITVMARGLS